MKQFLLAMLSLYLVNNSAFGIQHFVLISAPGSGKGTFSQYLVKKHGYLQICPGDLFRHEIELGTKLGKQIQPIVDRGDYVDEAIVCALIEKYIHQALDQNKGFIIDGFPRSDESFEFLDSLLEKNGLRDKVCFLQFDACDTVCARRILDRIVCTSCFMVYNKSSNRSKFTNICDNCGIDLSMRKADTPEIVQKRLAYFHDTIEPLLERAQKFYPIKKVNSECSFFQLESEYEKILQG